MADAEALQRKISDLEAQLAAQSEQHAQDLRNFQAELDQLTKVVKEFELKGQKKDNGDSGPADIFTRRAEWTIEKFTEKDNGMAKGQSLWSPKFKAAGLEGLQLEFFPKGREKTTFPGFCSLFLWCPAGTRAKYQLWCGSFQRAPEEDDYTEHIGHGHSSFCPVAPQVNKATESLTVGVTFLEVSPIVRVNTSRDTLRLIPSPLQELVSQQADAVVNRHVNKVVWRIDKISQCIREFPRGASMWSQLFAAAGIREILLEFYPNGSANTTKEGHCAFYIRCPQGISLMVTLQVGRVRRGPIKTVFEGTSGKGLPDFCVLEDQIDHETDSVQVGIELQNQQGRMLLIES